MRRGDERPMTGQLLVIETPGDWTDDAACQNYDPEWWYPGIGANPNQAKAICWDECTVREQCLQYALATNQLHGVWGGETRQSRAHLLRYGVPYPGGRRGGKPKPINHGSVSGAYIHYKRGEKPCEDCRLASAEYTRKRRARSAAHSAMTA